MILKNYVDSKDIVMKLINTYFTRKESVNIMSDDRLAMELGK